MSRRCINPLAALYFLGPCVAWGQAGASPAPSPSASPALPPPIPLHGGTGLLPLLVYFVLIVALLGAGLYFTRSGFGLMGRKGKGDRKLVISETRSLGNRQFLIVAEYETRKMLIGVCPGRIDYLSTLAGGGDETFSTELPDKAE